MGSTEMTEVAEHPLDTKIREAAEQARKGHRQELIERLTTLIEAIFDVKAEEIIDAYIGPVAIGPYARLGGAPFASMVAVIGRHAFSTNPIDADGLTYVVRSRLPGGGWEYVGPFTYVSEVADLVQRATTGERWSPPYSVGGTLQDVSSTLGPPPLPAVVGPRSYTFDSLPNDPPRVRMQPATTPLAEDR